MYRFFSIYERLVLSKPLLSLSLTLLLIGWLAMFIPNFKLDASADSLVLEGDQALKYYREISKRYSTEEFLLVVYEPEQPLLSDHSLQQIELMRSDLAALAGVSSVMTILDIPLLASPQVDLEELASGENIRTLRTPGIDKKLVSEELTNSPLYKDLLTSADGKTTGLQVNLSRDERYAELLKKRETLRQQRSQGEWSDAQQQQLVAAEQTFRDYALEVSEKQAVLVKKARAVIDSYRGDARIFLGGVPMITADMISFVKNDLLVFGSGILIFIIITMGLIFRRLVWVVLPLLTCLLSASFMLGLITWMDWRMTVISSNFVALLLIITLSITIHLVVRYRELLAENPAMQQTELVSQTMLLMVKPCIYTALTTIVAFASLVVSGIRPVIDFGWMMTIGVAAALVISFIVIPTGLLILGKPKLAAKTISADSTTVRIARITEHHGRAVLVVSVLLLLVGIVGISKLQVENRFIDYFNEKTEIYKGMEIIDAQLGGTIPLDIILDVPPQQAPLASVPVAVESTDGAEAFDDSFDAFGGDFNDDFSSDFSDGTGEEPSYWFNRVGLERIEQVHDYLDGLPETGKVLSLATPYKLVKQMTTGIDDIQLALIQSKLPSDIASIVVTPYLNEDIDQARITVRVMETSRSLHRDQLLKQVRQHLINDLGFDAEQVHLTGMLVLYNNMLQSLYKSQILTIGAVFIAIVAMFIILFRSLSVALIAIAPNILAAGLVLGGMGLAGIPLDIMTVTIAAITVGIAVDDTIHYVHRFKNEFNKDQNYVATMYRCHASIGKAMFYTSIIIIIGFSILALSNFNPSIYFGLLTGAAMFVALIGALMLLPQLLIAFKPFGANVEPAAPQVES
jgi:predicted RND superfamily exporter protein